MKMDKRMIAARANEATGIKAFFKSYIRNAKCVARRNVTDIWNGSGISEYEEDYEFTYKGKTYRVNESRRENYIGSYELVEV